MRSQRGVRGNLQQGSGSLELTSTGAVTGAEVSSSHTESPDGKTSLEQLIASAHAEIPRRLQRYPQVLAAVGDLAARLEGVVEELLRLHPHDLVGRQPSGEDNKRCSNERLLASGYAFRYPTFREGFAALLHRGTPDV